jgi:hypothetical protein
MVGLSDGQIERIAVWQRVWEVLRQHPLGQRVRSAGRLVDIVLDLIDWLEKA